MTEPITTMNVTFIPLTVFEDGWFHPAVRRESNLGPPQTTVYGLSYRNEEDAREIAHTFAMLEMRAYEDSIQAELLDLAERLKNPLPPLNLPNISTADRPPADVRGFDPARQAAWLWRFYYPEFPNNLPPPTFPPP